MKPLAWLYRLKILRLHLTFTKAEKNILLRALEARMEALTPDHKDVLELRQWMANPTPDFAATKALYDKIYSTSI